jgi:hypothetical protein
MVGFVARVERTSNELTRALDRVAEMFGFAIGESKAKLPGRERLLETLIRIEELDRGLLGMRKKGVDFVDLGGKGKPRLTRDRAIEAYRQGATTEELLEAFQVSPALARSLPAFKAHVTMGSYEGNSQAAQPEALPPEDTESITRDEALEYLRAGFSPAEIAAALPGASLPKLRAWAAHLTMGTYGDRAAP